MLKDKLYDFVVRRHSGVQFEYERYVQEHMEEHYENRLKHLKILFKLNWHYRVKKINEPMIYFEQSIYQKDVKRKKNSDTKSVQGNLPYLKGAESRLRKWTAPQDFVRMLMEYDVVSFDIFDTLIFRPFDRPRDVFEILGQKLNILDFANIRLNAEKKIRERNYEEFFYREAPLDEIYKQIEEETGLKAEFGKRAELELELDICIPNPYMKYVFDTIKAQGKRIVLVSDMYITKLDIEKMLRKCGYEGYEEIFISCDHKCSKREGKLYRVMKRYFGDEEKKIVHVGDNPTSDILMAEQEGLSAILYENVNSKGKQYRVQENEMSLLTGSAYRGIVNHHIHNGYKRYDAYYEYGFMYGGLFMFGYAQHIHEYAVKNGIEKILFVARDGYVIKKVYDMLFSDIKSEYVLCSRISNLKLSAYCNKQDYLKEFVLRWTRDGKKISVKDVLENMDLLDMTDKLPINIDLSDYMDDNNTKILQKFVCNNWEKIVKKYEAYIDLGRKYYRNFFEKTKKVLIVDIGWRGQGILALRSLEKDYWHFGCEIYGMLAASAPTKACVSQLQAGIIDTYMFSPIQNRQDFEIHSKKSINNILMELFAGAPCPSFRGFKEEGGDYSLLFDVPETANYEMISKIHEGILNFAQIYKDSFEKYAFMYNVSGEDAYAPIKHIFKEYSFIKRFLGKYEFQDCVGGTAGKDSRKISDVFAKFKL